MSVLKVQKRDGNIENWDREKLLTSVANIGLSSEEAQSITCLVEIWCQRSANDFLIDSLKIREKVIELLCAVHPQAAREFGYFRKI